MQSQIFVQGPVEPAVDMQKRINEWLDGTHPSGKGWIEVSLVKQTCASDGRLTISIWFKRGTREANTMFR